MFTQTPNHRHTQGHEHPLYIHCSQFPHVLIHSLLPVSSKCLTFILLILLPWRKLQITNVSNKRENIMADPTDIKR